MRSVIPLSSLARGAAPVALLAALATTIPADAQKARDPASALLPSATDPTHPRCLPGESPAEVPPPVEEAYAAVRQRMLEAAGDPQARVLVYAELSSASQASITRYQLPGEQVVRQWADGPELDDALHALWGECSDRDARWQGILLLVDAGVLRVHLLDRADRDRTLYEKDDEVTGWYFPGLRVILRAMKP